MYTTQRLYYPANPILAIFQKVGNFVIISWDIVERSFIAAQYAKKNPTDRETLLRIISGE